LLDVDSLVDLANVAVTLQYVGTCAAVTWLRLKKPGHKRSYRVPGGPFLVPLVGIGVCVLLLSQAAVSEFVFSGAVVVVGGILAAISMLVTRRRAL
jgi:amino acid transporter